MTFQKGNKFGMFANHKGAKSPMKGKKHSEESKRKNGDEKFLVETDIVAEFVSQKGI